MNSSGLSILCRMPWSRYSFLGREHINDGIVPNELKCILVKGVYSHNDISKLLRLIGKCSSDYKLIYNTNWSDIYEIIYSSMSKSAHWRFGSLVKLLQNASYLCNKLSSKSANIDFLKNSVEFVARKIGKNIREVSDKDICRVIYSCSKGNFLQNSFVPNSFLILLQNEVMQRMRRFETIDLLKLLHSSSSINFEKEFRICIINKILSNINKIGSIDISNLICYLHTYNLLNTDNKSIINNNIGKRLYSPLEKDVLLTLSLSLVMYGVVTLKVLEVILNKFQSMDLNFNDVLMLKLMIYYLKYNNQDLYESLGDKSLSFINKILLNFPNDVDYKTLDLTHNTLKQYKMLNQLLKMLELDFIPYIHGPYLLPLYNPITKSAIIINYTKKFKNSQETEKNNSVDNLNYSSSEEIFTKVQNFNLKVDLKVNGEVDSNSRNIFDNFMYNNMSYYNHNKLYHLRSERVKIIEIDRQFFNLNIDVQLKEMNNKVSEFKIVT
uniref:Uncharacterized protein n=1 Tax=Theileria annulata TaxID=5874 RepID=A0A3B0MUP7_THEAN